MKKMTKKQVQTIRDEVKDFGNSLMFEDSASACSKAIKWLQGKEDIGGVSFEANVNIDVAKRIVSVLLSFPGNESLAFTVFEDK